MKRAGKLLAIAVLLLALLTGCTQYAADFLRNLTVESTAAPVTQDGEYTSRDDVALYIHLYGELPGNYITKSQASKLGWNGGNLWDDAPGKSIGGDRFGNYEKLLPEGKSYRECDIDYQGGARNAKRIVFSDDGYIYYTEDHYASFEQLYP